MTLLDGIQVLEISANGSASVAAKHFADWGARVSIVEPPGGSPLRQASPWFEADGKRQSATWEWLSRGKGFVTGGLAHEAVLDMCLSADVVFVESELCMAVLGLAPAEVESRLGGLTTVVLISPFGVNGPYSAYSASDLGICAMGGWAGMIGDPDRQPLRPGGELMYRTTGLFAAAAGLVALRHRRQGGKPQFVDLQAQMVAASLIVSPWLMKSMTGVIQGRMGVKWPATVGECNDGYVGVSPLTSTHWEMLCQMMGIADVLDEPGGREPAYRVQHSEELYNRVLPWLQEHTREEVVTEAQSWRLPSAPVQDAAERLACPQLEARGFWKEMRVRGRDVKVPRVPYLIAGSPPSERGPLQECGPHEVTGRDPRRVAVGSHPPQRPFEGVRILDLTWFWSGPYATMMLGALGADVIKVESIQRPDSYRYTAANSSQERWYERGPLWNDTNCNKRGITLDLASPTGMGIFCELVKHVDIVISNFSNRVMPNLGLTPDRLLEINPRLISVTMPGYGLDGPWQDWVGYGVAFEQLAVCASVTGYADSLPRIPGGFCDPVVGVHTVMAIELALLRREASGQGAVVEVPQSETLDSLWAPEHIAVQFGTPVPSRQGNKHAWMAPHNIYRVEGQDSWISLAIASDEEFQSLSRVLGWPELFSSELFSTIESRKCNEQVLDQTISGMLLHRDGLQLEKQLQDVGVKACRVAVPSELTEDHNLVHSGFFTDLQREVTGTHRFKLWPFNFTDIPVSHRLPPPLLGQHTREVLSEILHLKDFQVNQLELDGVTGLKPVGFHG